MIPSRRGALKPLNVPVAGRAALVPRHPGRNLCTGRDPPSHDASGEHVDDQRHIEPTLPGRDVREVGHPQLIGTIRLERLVSPVQRTRRRMVRNRGVHDLAMPHTFQSQSLHETLDRAAGNPDAFAVYLAPDLVGPVDLPIGVPNPLDFRDQHRIALGTCWNPAGVALLGRMAPIPRGGQSARPCRSARPYRHHGVGR